MLTRTEETDIHSKTDLRNKAKVTHQAECTAKDEMGNNDVFIMDERNLRCEESAKAGSANVRC